LGWVKFSDRFHTFSGVHQGCVLAPALFRGAIDLIMDNMSGLVGVKIGRDKFRDLGCADATCRRLKEKITLL